MVAGCFLNALAAWLKCASVGEVGYDSRQHVPKRSFFSGEIICQAHDRLWAERICLKDELSAKESGFVTGW